MRSVLAITVTILLVLFMAGAWAAEIQGKIQRVDTSAALSSAC